MAESTLRDDVDLGLAGICGPMQPHGVHLGGSDDGSRTRAEAPREEMSATESKGREKRSWREGGRRLVTASKTAMRRRLIVRLNEFFGYATGRVWGYWHTRSLSYPQNLGNASSQLRFFNRKKMAVERTIALMSMS
jgi:hypothetical protein